MGLLLLSLVSSCSAFCLLLVVVSCIFNGVCALKRYLVDNQKVQDCMCSYGDPNNGVAIKMGKSYRGNGCNRNLSFGKFRVAGWCRSFCFWLVTFNGFRIGEASHPGPTGSDTWSLGTFNPSGLAHRADVVANLDGDFWGVTETHFSQIAYQKFVRGLRCQSSPFCSVVPGHACPNRSRSEVAGGFTGVAALTRWPCRALPHDIPIDLYQTARLQVVGVCIRNLWLTIGIMYGFPHSTSHLHPRFQTEQLLSSLIDRVGMQTVGPRVIMGDLNWERHELNELDRLESLGFVELQQAAHELWGTPILPTGRGTRRIDFVYISRELFGLLESVRVENDQWPDHAAVSGNFRDVQPVLERFHWKMPQKMHWPKTGWEIQEGPNRLESPTQSFASFWNKVEQVAVVASNRQHPDALKNCLGRGQTLESTKIVGSSAPVKKGRSGELQPAFFGKSWIYAQKFKQARRLQSLVAALAKPTNHHQDQVRSLWRKIRCSTGFPPGFGVWWENLEKP